MSILNKTWATLAIACAILSVLGARSALADGPTGSMYIRSHTMGWQFAPAVQAGTVAGFLGWEEDSNAVLNNLKVMWFERGAGGRWTSWAWQENDLGAAVSAVQFMLADQSLFSHDPELMDAQANFNIQNIAIPDPVIKGMFADDMLANIVQSCSNPDAMVEQLASVGWPVGATLSAELAKASQECQGELKTALDGIMDHLANRAETALFAASVTPDPCAAIWPCDCLGTVAFTPTGAGTWALTSNILTGSSRT